VKIRPLGVIVASRIALFAGLAMVAQLALVFADYYWNDDELSRLLVERETTRLADGLSLGDGKVSFALPASLSGRYGKADSGYYARLRTTAGRVLYLSCNKECTEHFLPVDFRPPDFWLRTIHPGKPLTLAGGRTFEFATDKVLVEVAVIADPQEVVWSVLGHEVMDHMLVPMGIILVLVLGATLMSVRTALRPVRAAAHAAEAIDPLDARSHLDTTGMPQEIARLAEAINGAFRRVGDLMKAQKLLTSAIAHEVRTPLAVVKLELERIDHPRARKAEADLDELVRFVSQLTALARLEAVDHASLATVSVGRLVENLVESMAPWVYERGHSISLDVEADFQVVAIESLLRDAVRNLVENAVGHTPKGTAIAVSVSDRSISVADNGGGYGGETPAVELVDTIKKGGGLGIGLEIVRRIAKMHNAEFQINRRSPGTVARLVFTPR